MDNISKNIKRVYKKIYIAAHHANKDPNTIKLVAVTKNQSIHAIKSALSIKQNNFGENYAQEALKKIQWFQKNTTDKLIWHFIGTLQSNKSKIIAENFDWCHTITSAKLIYKLHVQRPKILNYLNVLIQINISDNPHRSGIYTTNCLLMLAEKIHHCSRLKLRGIMAMSVFTKDFEKQLLQFKKANVFFQKLKNEYPHIDTLSLGMSNDFIAAIYAGSNLVRIGTDIFGCRSY